MTGLYMDLNIMTKFDDDGWGGCGGSFHPSCLHGRFDEAQLLFEQPCRVFRITAGCSSRSTTTTNCTLASGRRWSLVLVQQRGRPLQILLDLSCRIRRDSCCVHQTTATTEGEKLKPR